NAVRDTSPVHVLHLKSRFSIASLRYSDTRMASDNFYANVYHDTVQTRDSLRYQQFRNDALYSFQSTNRKFSFFSGFRNEINTLWQHGDSVQVNNFAVAGASYARPFVRNDSIVRRSYGVEVNTQYGVSGPLQGNYQLNSTAFFAFDE